MNVLGHLEAPHQLESPSEVESTPQIMAIYQVRMLTCTNRGARGLHADGRDACLEELSKRCSRPTANIDDCTGSNQLDDPRNLLSRMLRRHREFIRREQDSRFR